MAIVFATSVANPIPHCRTHVGKISNAFKVIFRKEYVQKRGNLDISNYEHKIPNQLENNLLIS